MQEQKSEEEIIRERKERVIKFVKRKEVWIIGILIIALVLGLYIRSLPMQDHTSQNIPSFTNFILFKNFKGQQGLYDITTKNWTLGPDLDPWLFTRYAKEIIINGKLEKIDYMRNVPIGFDNSMELQMISYMIVLTYKFTSFVENYDINFSAAFMPVWVFGLTIIAFFLFVREIFIRKDKDNFNANIIALISTFFMITIPTFLSRTVAGIPEKESVGFMFMFLALYLFLKSWKTENIKIAIIFACLTGITTGLMGLTWGGVTYLYVTIGVASLAAFAIGKVQKKETIIYSCWIIVSVVITLLLTNRFSVKGFLTSIDTGLAIFALFIFIVHYFVWNTRIKEMKYIRESKLPQNLISFIISIILGVILISIFFGPSILTEKIKAFNQMMFKPVTGRWSMTVAENRQPYFTEWAASFGPNLGKFPMLFWLFFAGSIVLFKKMISNLKKKDAWVLTCAWVLFFCGLVFSRYATHPALLDGEGLFSKIFYYGSAFIFLGLFVYYYIQYKKENNHSFETIEFEYIFLFVLFLLCLFTARSAVRLIMVLGPIAPIFMSYLIMDSIERFRKPKEETTKIITGIIMIFLVLSGVFIFNSYYKEVKVQAYSSVPYDYNMQWQKAMQWVRNETPQNSVFVHWWDYGYWVQSIGNRATVTDGGNAITYWNYLTGRYILTGDNQKDALELSYNHNASYLLIDSTDLGKYGAFASIGSNENYDRYSQGPATLLSPIQSITENIDGMSRDYYIDAGNGKVGLVPFEEDLVYNNNGTKITLPSETSALMLIRVYYTESNGTVNFNKAEAIFVSNQKQLSPIKLRYLYYNNEFMDFKDGVEATAYIVPRVSQNGIDNMGALQYISPRLMRGLLSQIYLLNDPFKKFSNFKIAHVENSMIIQNVINQGYKINDFAYIDGRGIQGPIKIWKINYNGDEKIKQEYIDTDATKYLSWQL